MNLLAELDFTGLVDNRRAVIQSDEVPCLFIESDMTNNRVVGEAQLENRIAPFFEDLASGTLRAQAGP